MLVEIWKNLYILWLKNEQKYNNLNTINLYFKDVVCLIACVFGMKGMLLCYFYLDIELGE